MKNQIIDFVKNDCEKSLEPILSSLEPLKNSTVAVVGGTGFVGSWITELVTTLNDNHGFNSQLVVVARSIDFFKDQHPHLSDRKDLHFLKTDVRNAFFLPKETEWLVHAAASPDRRQHSSYPVEIMSVIANGTETSFRAVERCSQFKMFLNLSSASVYGEQPWDLERLPESYHGSPSLTSVSDAYAEAKRYGEMLCSSFRSQARIPVVNVRPFAFLGPFQRLNSPWAINNFIQDALEQRPIRVLGDGETVRSYLYGSDCGAWALRMLTGSSTGEYYNLGSPEAVSLKQLAEMVSSAVTHGADIQYSTGSVTQAKRSKLVPDVTKACEKLGLSITVPLREALDRTIQYYQLSKE